MASVKGRKKSEIKAAKAKAKVAAAAARMKAAVEAGIGRKVAKTTKGQPVAAKPKLGRPPRLGPDGKPATCGVAECVRPYRCMGYCSAHYQFARGTRPQCAPNGPADKAIGAWPMPLTKTNWRPRVVGLPIPRPTGRRAS